MSAARLIIFDIDGTLLLNGPVTARGFLHCFEKVVGRGPAVGELRFHGGTDRGIFRSLLGDEGPGLAGEDFDALFARFAAAFTRHMMDVYGTAEGPHSLPGAPELVAELHRDERAALALGTGNIRETAYVKLARFGLDQYFPAGGFGGDHELRPDLVRAALEESNSYYGKDFQMDSAWVIGDTANDVAAARAAGCRVMAVCTGPSGPEELAGADIVVEDLRDARARVAELLDGD